MNGLADLVEKMRGGAAGNAGKIAQIRNEYRDYVADAQSRGETPVSFEEFSKARGVNPNPYQNPKP